MSITVVNTNLIRGAATTLELGGNDLGPTDKGLAIKYEPEWTERYIDQSKYPVRIDFVKGKCTVETTLADAKLANLHKAFGMDSDNLSGCCLTLDDDAEEDGATLKIIGPGPNGQTRTFYFFQVMLQSGFTYNMSRDEDSVMPIVFNCLLDGATNKIGYVLDAAA